MVGLVLEITDFQLDRPKKLHRLTIVEHNVFVNWFSLMEQLAKNLLMILIPGEYDDGHDVADEAEDRDSRQEHALDDEPEGRSPSGGRSAKAGWSALMTCLPLTDPEKVIVQSVVHVRHVVVELHPVHVEGQVQLEDGRQEFGVVTVGGVVGVIRRYCCSVR